MLLVCRRAKHICFALLLILQGVLPSTMGLAQMATPHPLTLAVPEEWRGPYTQFLTSLGLKDPMTILTSTKFGHIGSLHRPDSVVFRIENEDACNDDICLTFIGHLIDGHLVADAQFGAGPRITLYDTAQQIAGLTAFPLLFEGSTGTTVLFETATGWIVIPPKK